MIEALWPIAVCILAILLDHLFSEPNRHPLVAFGNAANWLESKLNNQISHPASKWRGTLATALLLVFPLWGIVFLQLKLNFTLLGFVLEVAILYFVIGWQSMKQHATSISKPLTNGEIQNARQSLAMIVSRETDNLSETQIAGSTIESVLENGHDSLFASLFWYALLGPFGALMHRLVNTLDAMWGYKNDRFLHFGYTAARFDDILGYVPARLTAICYALCGQTRSAFRSWRNQIGKHPSPNAGLVMAAGAGALSIKIGGPTVYNDILKQKPHLGSGPFATVVDIRRAVMLCEKSIFAWLVLYALILFALTFLS